MNMLRLFLLVVALYSKAVVPSLDCVLTKEQELAVTSFLLREANMKSLTLQQDHGTHEKKSLNRVSYEILTSVLDTLNPEMSSDTHIYIKMKQEVECAHQPSSSLYVATRFCGCCYTLSGAQLDAIKRDLGAVSTCQDARSQALLIAIYGVGGADVILDALDLSGARSYSVTALRKALHPNTYRIQDISEKPRLSLLRYFTSAEEDNIKKLKQCLQKSLRNFCIWQLRGLREEDDIRIGVFYKGAFSLDKYQEHYIGPFVRLQKADGSCGLEIFFPEVVQSKLDSVSDVFYDAVRSDTALGHAIVIALYREYGDVIAYKRKPLMAGVTYTLSLLRASVNVIDTKEERL